ncbi:hypothetical protein [Aquimarina muelleri]|uniref:Uncharacterized protein n=1 Tax=Aquimarina muelleri TaxID=279356 RepID=A0A918JSS1_9FLAO|nr:hypothetical protein [Aquimarina muelleri]MCX2761937.1 hypothetical protein [Aquimarina muelleri]GGX10509.1 hypothetical protein GCM10007384_10290 [Aquimarina muelleri]
MKLLLTLLLLFYLFFIPTITAQNIYESGYFIDNDGNRKECLIKKISWKQNPTEFTWKKTISSSPSIGKIKDYKEFGVGQDYIFKRYIMKFDLRGDNIGKSTKSKNPELKIKKVFLRVILKSEASLYQYSENDVHRFFYTSKDTPYPDLLIYKTYYIPDDSKKAGKKVIPKANTQFKEQLQQYVNCRNQDVGELTHSQRDLKNYFSDYNNCKGAKIEYIVKRKISQTKVGLIASLDFVSFSHPSEFNLNQTVTYDNTLATKYGIYLETFIPFYKVDLSFFLESTYRAFSTQQNNAAGTITPLTLDFKSINVALAPRFHVYLSSDFELFFEGGLSVDHDLGTKSVFNSVEKITLDYFYGGGFGVGRFKVGYRIYTDKNIAKSETLSTSLSNSKLSTSSLYISINLSKYNKKKLSNFEM